MDYSNLSDEKLLKLAEENKIDVKKEELKIDPNNFINGIIHGNSLDVLKKCPNNHFDSVVTDPPYGLSFMGKKWDYDVPSVELWKEVLRVLKPGGHLLSFAGSRTYHRMAVNIEDAGFEIRDQIMWIYGSGFPKSHNIGKAVDKLEGNDREVVGKKKLWGHNAGTGAGSFSKNQYEGKTGLTRVEDLTKGTSKWEGWGTALKPAHEPIVVARKPLSEKTIAKNVLKYGIGGINIDACRISHNEPIKTTQRHGRTDAQVLSDDSCEFDNTKNNIASANPQGRFPANIILDEEAGKMLDEQSGQRPSGKSNNNAETGESGIVTPLRRGKLISRNDKGGASRFFYCPKSSKAERNKGCERLEPRKNFHPTVKPIKLMEYLIKLVTPPGGVVLDPFAGSGTTLVSAKNLGFNAVVIEMSEEYVKIIKARTNS